MGNICGGGNPYKGSKEEQDINNRIEKQLRQQRKELETEIKMLLLGTPSTLFTAAVAGKL